MVMRHAPHRSLRAASVRQGGWGLTVKAVHRQNPYHVVAQRVSMDCLTTRVVVPRGDWIGGHETCAA